MRTSDSIHPYSPSLHPVTGEGRGRKSARRRMRRGTPPFTLGARTPSHADPQRGEPLDPAYRRLLSHPVFREFWLGTLMVRLGAQVAVLGLTWLVLETTGSAARIGLVLAVYAMGDIVASPLVGVLLDRWPRRLLLLGSNALQGVLFLAITGFYLHHGLNLPLLLVLVAAAGALAPLAYLGRSVILPSLVDSGDWEPANAVLQLNLNVVSLLGPALGGILVAAVGVAATLIIAAGCYAVYVVVLARLPRPSFRGSEAVGSPPPGSWMDDLRSGLQYVLKTPVLALLALVTLLFSLTYGPLEPALPLLVSSVYHDGAQVLGLLWSSFAAGAVLGTFAWVYWQPRIPLRLLVAGIIAAWGVCSGLVGAVPGPVAAGALLALGGFTYAPYNIVWTTWRQRLVPDHLRGRVFGLINGVSGVGLPLGQAVGGLLVAGVGPQATVMVGGAACVLLGAVVLAQRRVWTFDEASWQSGMPAGARDRR